MGAAAPKLPPGNVWRLTTSIPNELRRTTVRPGRKCSRMALADGNWSVGVIIDERATTEQKETLVAIARGQAGGPMEPMLALTTEFLGVESRPILFQKNGMKWSVLIRRPARWKAKEVNMTMTGW